MTPTENHRPKMIDSPNISFPEESVGFELQSEIDSDTSMLYEAWVVLRRRRYWALVLLALSILGSVLFAKLQAPEYDSSSVIRILQTNSGDIQFGDSPASQLLGSNSETKIQTEMSVLKSKTLALRVADVLDLYRDVTFSKPGEREGYPSRNNSVSVYRVLTAMKEAVRVLSVPHTDNIMIVVRTHSPQLSEKIANTLVDEYVDRGYQVRFKSQVGISEWLAKQLDDLRKQTEAAQTRALEYGKKLDLLNSTLAAPANAGGGTAPESLAAQRLLGLQQALTGAESERLVKEAQFHVLESADSSALPPQSDPVLANLLTTRANATNLLQQYSLKYGPNYSHIKELKTQIDELNTQIEAELGNARKHAQAELAAAREAEQSLQRAVEANKGSMQQHQTDLIQYTIAQRDFESSYALYQGLLQKLKEAGVLAGLHANDVEIIDRGLVPIFKSAPRLSIYLMAGLGIGVVAGILLAFLVDSLDTSILDVDVLEQTTGVPTIGVIPKVRAGQSITINSGIAESELDSSARRMMESCWALRTSLLLSHAGAPPRTIAITSAVPAEGKTTMAINLALTLAQGEDRVLLIECDLRRPTFGHKMRIGGAGLTQFLAGIKPLSECIRTMPDQSYLDIMPAGLTPPNPAQLLGSRQFRNLLAEMRSKYKFIILDSPPIASVSDVQIIAAEMDGVLLVVRSASTSRHIVQRSCRMLRQTGARLLGSVLNGMDFRSDKYGYYGYVNYYSSHEHRDNEVEEETHDVSR
ncbi:polysaccharide biosynthesis tyrosine autokinase [Acidobacteria bacterium AB60]|nr:polysaccharide biosynthesis tyrosine autokinase [Acidobacteria bacterium AB60]